MSRAATVNREPKLSNERRSVLVTGAAGRIGSAFCLASKEKYDLRLMVRGDEERIDTIEACGEVVEGQLEDLDVMHQFCEGMDSVLHLAADPSTEASWQSLLPNNIVGTYNAVTAAERAGCRRLVMASSVNAVGGYPTTTQVRIGDPLRPANLYGVSKCFLEAMGRHAADNLGLSTITIRFGAFIDPDEAPLVEQGESSNRVSQRDGVDLMQRAIDVEDVHFAIVHGLSAGPNNRMDLTETHEVLGYEPQDYFGKHRQA